MVFVNKAVLISTPDLPLTFLVSYLFLRGRHPPLRLVKFIQLALAVLLLHVASFVASGFPGSEYARKIELPEISLSVSRQLLPLVTISIVGLVFNTLCLRDVDASFFQAGVYAISKINLLFTRIIDRTRTFIAIDNRHLRPAHSHPTYTTCRASCSCGDSRIFRRCLPSVAVVFVADTSPRCHRSLSVLRIHVLPHDCPACRPRQICTFLCWEFVHQTGVFH